MTKKVDLIVDLQYGSTGKGLIAGYLAEKHGYDVVVNANMPNAGHTYINREGREFMHKVLPNGIVSPNIKFILLGAGSVFSLDRLVEEIESVADILIDKDAVILIHPNAVLLQEHHTSMEQSLGRISSTMQGSMEALVEKMRRSPDSNITAKDNRYEIHERTCGLAAVATHDRYNEIIENAGQILAEGAQGFSLSLNERFWPYCTSRDCTPARFMSDCGLPLAFLRKVVGTARVHPIRVGNTSDGFSGTVYPDQVEIDFDSIGVPTELTTVTKRPRRVFTFSEQQMGDAIWACRPDEVFLNFCNYDREAALEAREIINHQCQKIGLDGVGYTGWGPAAQHINDHNDDGQEAEQWDGQ